MEHIVPQIKRELQAKYGHSMIKWYEAVEWKEPLIVGLIAAHVALLATVVLTRKQLGVQFALFVLILGLVFVAEHVNRWCRLNWRSFATQNYFDESGVFMAIFYGGPLLVIGFLQLVRRALLWWSMDHLDLVMLASMLTCAGFFVLFPSQLLSMKSMVNMVVIVKRAEYKRQLQAKKATKTE
ncbi:TPA: hypothetical protein N0F65_006137 [Lagenidium giganteum]|uniref:Transmembrane protein 18 n=1 Tax=Lagenidium giganteum TaxID=4803 RepID=A0AAV2Z2L9_9STRA|nr:TPA: hypothetical protein N0F65_006137 [Lagenidium giganteum]